MNELMKLIKQANECAKPSTLNRIRKIADTLGIARGDIKLMIKSAVDGEMGEWSPSRAKGRNECQYDETSTRIRTQQYC